MSENCENCKATKKIIQTWVDQQGHDRCWYYPEVFRQLANLFSIQPKATPALPSRKEFEEGCRRYQSEEYKDREP